MGNLSADRPITLAILAVGGQGGGVLTDWIVHLAEHSGWYAQSTSVPGVAQRTGATIYYVEMIPENGGTPILALMPTPGEVDIVIAAEMMEAGRAMQRGLVSPDRTTLIASTHRAYAVAEKQVPGDGIADGGVVTDVAAKKARRVVAFDMQRIAEANGSVISSSLFGALAGSGALPFPRAAYEATISAGGKGVKASLAAFSAAFDATRLMGGHGDGGPVAGERDGAPVGTAMHEAIGGSPRERAEFDRAIARIAAEFPSVAADMIKAGLVKVVDFQDAAYGQLYLDRLSELTALDRVHGSVDQDHLLTREAAKYLANAMAYDDVIRVADLKTRAARMERVRREVGVGPDQIMQVTEFMHPRMQEVCGMMPVRLGRAVEGRPKLFTFLDRAVNRGRHVRTDTMFWFSTLYVVAGMKRFRRSLLRHRVEEDHIAEWLDLVRRTVPQDYRLAVEILRCRRLIKGYSDTHVRGISKFDRVLSALPLLKGRPDAADWVRRLREAALKDEQGTMLDGALRTVASLET
ncbi:MAG TPA: indolepyruvate oxidoreductase subunit beta family protein [Alphaproteobacteria bacterium]|nr:indolepyruvate oxidoreductase subunit beta family protein [Alphaproteobacteria bacterium]